MYKGMPVKKKIASAIYNLQASSLARSESAEVNKFLVDQQPDEDSG
jgi:hypothetical protein